MARTDREMADILIELYKEKDEKKKGLFRITKDDFKSIAGKANLKEAYFWAVDSALREDGYILIDMKEENSQIAMISISTVEKKFQELPAGLVEEYRYPTDNDEW